MKNKKLKTVLSAILSLAVVGSITACGETDNGTGGQTNSVTEPDATTAATTTNEVVTFERDEEVIAQVEAVAENAKLDLEVTKKITWLAWWDMDETQAAAEMFKQLYGVPQEGDASFGDDADNIFENISCTYAERYTRLATMVSGGVSPDIFPFEINNYPYTVYKGMFQSIDGIVDTYSEEWSATRDVMDMFMWGGKNYCAIPEVNTSSVLWYKPAVAEEAGCEDPYELYKAGNWTWDTFLEMCETFQQSGEDKYALDGYNPEDKLLLSTGTAMISLEDGQLVSNLNSTNIERAIELIQTLQRQNYRYPRHELNAWSTNVQAWATGDTLFFEDGQWFMKDQFGAERARARYDLEFEDVFFVPFPKDPNADAYYQEMKQDAYMLCGGSDNVEGFQAWTQCVIAATNDESVKAASRAKALKDLPWTEEQLDFFDEITETLTPIFDFKNGIGSDIASTDSADNCIASLTKYPYIYGDANGSFVQLRAQNEGQINQRLEELNASA